MDALVPREVAGVPKNPTRRVASLLPGVIKHWRWTAAFLASVALIRASSAPAAEPVTVYTMSPTLLEQRASFERVLSEYPQYQRKWESQQGVTLTYIVSQRTVGLVSPEACEGLPIRVRVIAGRLARATYAASGGRCQAGQTVGRARARADHLYLTPAEFFGRIAEARKQLKCYSIDHQPGCLPTALRVTYDERFGFPIKMEDYSAGVADYYWSLEVSEIRVVP